MPQEKNTLARIVVPIVVAVLGLGLAIAFLKNSQSQRAKSAQLAKDQTPPSTTPTMPSAGATPTTKEGATQPAPTNAADAAFATSQAPANQPGAAQPAPSRPAPAEPATGASPVTLRARVFEPSTPPPLGSLDAGRAPRADRSTLPTVQLEFAPEGAGLKAARLASYFETVDRAEPVALQSQRVRTTDDAGQPLASPQVLTPFAALGVMVDGVFVRLDGTRERPVWRAIAGAGPGAFEAIIADDQRDIVRVERRYELSPGSHTIKLRQTITNLSDRQRTIQWFQVGPIDPPKDALAYVGDRRRYRFGYLLDASRDPSRASVVSDAYLLMHDSVVGPRAPDGTLAPELKQWPNERSRENDLTLVWAGVTNRYFGVAACGLAPTPPLAWVAEVNRVALDMGTQADGRLDAVVGLRFDSAPFTLPPPAEGSAYGQPPPVQPASNQAVSSQADLSLAIYIGPLDRPTIRGDAIAGRLGIDGLVVFNMGGPCAWCTFSWLTGALLWLLDNLSRHVVFDWGVAIIVLVLIVRTLLHPVTKWSQIRMTRFGKKMQGMAPKMKALQEKFAGDRAKLQQETAKLWREEGVSPAGMLGCVPMFLQMPIWIALSATLFFAVGLRHAHGFYGVFQAVQPRSSPFWHFLADLASPDRFWYWGGKSFSIPLISGFMGPIESLNLLPILLGAVFYVQQKYLTPPTTTTLTPEQELQMKMTKWMMVFMTPLFMYNAPAGLTLYFCASSTFSILESRYIRRHIDELDKRAPAAKPGTKKKGFLQRAMEAAEARKKLLEDTQRRQGGPARRR